MNSTIDQIPVGLIAELLEHDTGIMASIQNPIHARNFRAFFFASA